MHLWWHSCDCIVHSSDCNPVPCHYLHVGASCLCRWAIMHSVPTVPMLIEQICCHESGTLHTFHSVVPCRKIGRNCFNGTLTHSVGKLASPSSLVWESPLSLSLHFAQAFEFYGAILPRKCWMSAVEIAWEDQGLAFCTHWPLLALFIWSADELPHIYLEGWWSQPCILSL